MPIEEFPVIEEFPAVGEGKPIVAPEIKKERPFFEFLPSEPAHRLAAHDPSIITGIPEAFDSLRNYSTDKIGMDPYPLKGLRAGLSSLSTEGARFGAELLSDPFALAGGAFNALKGRLPGIAKSAVAPTIEKTAISDINFRTPEAPIAKPKVRINLDGTFSPIDNPEIKLDKVGTPITSPIQKLNAALKDAVPLTEQQKAIYSAERSQRVASAEDVTTPGLAGHYERLGRLAGEHTKVQMQPIKLNPEDIDSLVDTINASDLMRYGKENATTGLTKILSGQVPQKSEIDLLEHVFGKEHIDEMRAHLPLMDVKRSMLMEAANLPRSIQTAYDLSFPFRQGLGLIHTKPWWTSWGSMLRSYGSEKAYRGVMDSILERPNYQEINGKSFARRAGLALTDLTDMSKREEAIMSTIAEKIPGVRAGNRAYTAFANKLRADNFDSMISNAEKIYETAKLTGAENAELLNPKYNLKLAQDIASYINNASGRGSLGKWEKNAAGLNSFLFSPKLITSRLAFMNPKNYVWNGNAQTRKAYLKSLLAMAGTWTTLASLAKMGGADVSLDPNNADFGKIKIGNTRLDPAAGFQQYLVLLARIRPQFAGGGYTSSTTGAEGNYGEGFGSPTRLDALIDFIENKLAPIPGYSARSIDARENRQFDVIDQTLRMFTPMFLQDLSELVQEDPALVPAIIPSLIGMGSQTYGDRGESSKLLGEEQPEMPIY